MMLGPDDLWLFNEGAQTRLHEHLGAHEGTDAAGVEGTWFGVWAPNARAVSVLADLNGWRGGESPLTAQDDSGIWTGFVAGIGHGDRYKYRIESRANGYTVDKASPNQITKDQANKSVKVIMMVPQPYYNHYGGRIAFGPDGFLYVGLGDGGSGDDPGHRAQNPLELLGKMLRIDVNVPDTHPTGYQVPATNPFASAAPMAARPEIWALGLRNPWRYSFDDPARGGTGALVIGDVGQNRWEEIDYEPANRGGRNYGWRNREGLHDNVTTRPPASLPLVDPIHEYDHATGQSITGGYVYRGAALPASFRGRYFFADFVQGRVWSIALTIDGGGEARASGLIEHTAELSASAPFGSVSSFGVDGDDELYLVSYSLGRVFKIVGPSAAPATPSGLRIVR